MYPSRNTVKTLFAKKYIRNFTFESIELSINDLKKVRFLLSHMKKCFEQDIASH